MDRSFERIYLGFLLGVLGRRVARDGGGRRRRVA